MTGFLTTFLTAVDVLVALGLIGLVLVQQSKGGGGLGAIGGESTDSIFGASTGNILTKATTMLAAVFLGVTLALAVISGHRSGGESVLEKKTPGSAETEQPAEDAEGAIDDSDGDVTESSVESGLAEEETDTETDE